jgi:hypothetical protein
MELDYRRSTASVPLVALFAWLLPGAGYLLLGQRGRAMGVGITIIVLFVCGLLIAGVRVIEVPGFEVATGNLQMYPVLVEATDANGKQVLIPAMDPATHRQMRRWILTEAPLSEIREKPWSVPQVMTGPLAILAGAWSISAAGINPATGNSLGGLTHARINEIGSLYLSVAGLLNLMAIIDSSWRAAQLHEPAPQPKDIG